MKAKVINPSYLRLALALVLAVAAVLLGTEPSYAAPAVALTPATAQPNQAVSVTGTGFTKGTGVTVSSIALGGVLVPGDKINTGNTVQVDSAGNFVAIVLVPVNGATLTAGGLTLLVTDSLGGQSSATLTVPTPALSVSPTTSRVGATVTVTGSNFHVASSRAGADSAPSVNLYYNNNSGLSSKLMATVMPDVAGAFTATFDVPVSATVGLKNTVKAVTVGGPAAGVSADHTVPAPAVTISPTSGAPESTLTVSGVNLPAFTPVKDLAFAHVGQLSATPVFTDVSGTVSLTVKVPLLENGAYPVRLQVGETSYIVAFTIQGSWYKPPSVPPPPPPSTDSAEGLAPLGENLVRAWNLDNAAKTWTFYDPDPALTGLGSLTRLVEGLVYWVRVKADQTAVLNGKERTLFQGWNLIPW
ncbi:MAG TPA: hypothetical protein VI855_07340 [Dehalococcoidia bacterium]|nr:hypothetical protein [Dehalococcoidia bacterium]